MSAAEMVRQARALVAEGDAGRAAQLLSRAREHGAEVVPELARALAGFRVRSWSERLADDLIACLAHPGVDPQMLAGIAASLLFVGPEGHPLWLAYLTRCINIDPDLEARIAAMRRGVLARGEVGPLAEALAVQGFANEYAVPFDEAEARALAAAPPALVAMYRTPEAGEALPPALARIAGEVAREREIAAALPSLGAEAELSAAVRAQYEANPYPRWRAPPASPPVALREVVVRLPGVDVAALPDASWEVLVAGCGTGFEAIDLARIDPALSVTGLDLSRASLAYGARMAAEMGVGNVQFVQGDLLGLGALSMPIRDRHPGESRDPESRVPSSVTLDPGLRRDDGGREWQFISSTGVLHHLDDPAAGLAALRDVLAPGGVLRIALYSRRARALVAEAHRAIREHAFGDDSKGIRAFRAYVLALPPEAPLAGLRHSEDFYSLSGCRDLCFHVREHVYDLPEVRVLVEGAGLRIAGFDAPPEAVARYRAEGGTDPLDFDAWDAVEALYPGLFAGMYQLWCQRPS